MELDEIIKELNSTYEVFKNSLGLDSLPPLSLSITTDGKLKVGQDLPKCMKLFLSERLCKNLGLIM